jgi:hypothetical protein
LIIAEHLEAVEEATKRNTICMGQIASIQIPASALARGTK